MSVYGVTPEGFFVKPLTIIRDEIQSAYRAELGASIDTSPESILGQIIDIHSERESELWELALAVWNARTPDGAGGVSLDQLAAYTGTVREAPRKSVVDTIWTGTPGTPIPAARVVSVVGSPTSRFATLADATVGGGGSVSVEMESEEYGPIVANAGTLSVIETPVGGIASVTNPLDALLGAGEESDASLRQRREDELRGDGYATAEAIRVHVLRVAGVTNVHVFHNTSAATDSDGLPGHHVEVMATGGDDQAILQAIWESVAAGIGTHGDITGTVVDAAGDLQAVAFSRPEELPIKVQLTFEHTNAYPVDGDTLMKEAVVTMANQRFGVGQDILLSPFIVPAMGVTGVYDVTSVGLSVDPAPVAALPVVVTSRQRGTFDTGRIVLVKTAVVPS